MDNITIYNVEQGSEAWHDLRCGRITASTFSNLMAGETTASYQGLVYETVGQILSGEMEEGFTSDAMMRGIELEPQASDYYSELNDTECIEVGFVTNSKYWDEYFGVSPDRMLDKNGILEIKCPLAKTHIGYLRDNKLPNAYKWQVQGQLLITEAEYCDFMSYYPNIKPFILRVEPDLKMHKELTERMEKTVNLIRDMVNKYK